MNLFELFSAATFDSEGCVSECISCNKPLGYETKDLGLVLCHKCRVCATCNQPIVDKHDLDYLITNHVAEIKHCRCLSLDDRLPITADNLQSEVDRLNLCILEFNTPNQSISISSNEQVAVNAAKRAIVDMDIKELLIRTRMLEAVCAQFTLAINKVGTDRKSIEKSIVDADIAKYKENLKAITKVVSSNGTAIVSVQSPKKPETSNVELTQFMTETGITEPKTAKAMYREREKWIKSVCGLAGISRDKALEQWRSVRSEFSTSNPASNN